MTISHFERRALTAVLAAKRFWPLAMAPSPDGYLQYRSKGWDVSGNLRPASDRYVAAKEGKGGALAL